MADFSTLPEGVQRLPLGKWENAHQNFTHTFQKDASFKLIHPASAQSSADKYRRTTENFQWLIGYAQQNNIRLRAMGNGWSFSDVAVCEGGAVDTKSLTVSFVLKDSFVAPDYLSKGGKSADLFFAQCGISVFRLNEILETELNPKRCLKASGASNGQSIAGATATGTHGSAFDVGAVHDAIVGLHFITGPNRHVWIEKKSRPVASQKFIDWLGAEPIRDDEVFNAAVVSFGAFGFLHGVLLETAPIYLLEKHISPPLICDNAMLAAIGKLDFEAISDRLPFPYDPANKDRELYHFEVIVNLHRFEENNPDKGVYVRTMYKIPYRTDYPKPPTSDRGFTYGDDLLGVVQTVIDNLGAGLVSKLVPALVTKLLPLAFTANDKATGTMGEIFTNTRFRGKAASTAIAVNAADAPKVLEEIVASNSKAPFPGALALRYVKGTSALLGFTHFEKTCIMELDGVDSDLARTFYENTWDRLEELKIPFTLHWGKINTFLDGQKLKSMYSDRVDRWINCRQQLLDAKTRKVFTNSFMDRCGLSANQPLV